MMIGPLRERVTLQSQSTTRSSTGASTKTWTTVATVWASVEPQTGKAFFAADQEQSEQQIRVRIRYSTDVNGINTSWRVKHGSRYYDIVSVANHQERDRLYTLHCIEGRRDDE